MTFTLLTDVSIIAAIALTAVALALEWLGRRYKLGSNHTATAKG